MSKKTLLLNSTYETLSFIGERKTILFLIKGKVESLSFWDDNLQMINGNIKLPSILRLKYYVRRNPGIVNFSRHALVKRDKGECQFCKKRLTPSQITIDHVLPKAQGGGSSFINCVVSCHDCNNKKGNRTPEQANMPLIRKPVHPSFSANLTDNEILLPKDYWHCDWDHYFK